MTRLTNATKRRKVAAVNRWRSPMTRPSTDGWYEVLAPDNRWDGQTNWRLYKGRTWWRECVGDSAPRSFTPYVTESSRFRWREPKRPAYLRYSTVMSLAGRPMLPGEGCA